ncbi:MAG: dTMP kinase [Bacillota bacterium]
MEGRLITLEGLDGSGKTTQAKSVYQYLLNKGFKVLLVREPGGTSLSEEIRRVLLDPGRNVHPRTEVFLYAASRSQLMGEVITTALKRHEVIVCDRFTDSSVAYQGYGRELGPDLVKEVNYWATGGINPHLTLLLDIDPRWGLMRVQNRGGPQVTEQMDRLEQEDLTFHQRVRDGYLSLAREDPNRIKIISAAETPEFVFKQIAFHVDRLLEQWG